VECLRLWKFNLLLILALIIKNFYVFLSEMKKKSFIKKFSAYLVLHGYLLILITSAFHFHKLDIEYESILRNSDNSKISGHNFFSCPIEFAYYSIHNTIINDIGIDQQAAHYIEIITRVNNPSKTKKEFYSHFSLRAPPIKIYSKNIS
jgi:hypothetical protein